MPIIDSFAGYLAVIGVFAALRRRDASGTGEHVDVAMLDAALKLVNTSVAVHSYTGQPPVATGNRGFRLVATSEFYRTADGWIALGANNQPQVESLLKVLGHPEMIDDPMFCDHAARVEHYAEVRDWLTRALLNHQAEDLETKLTATGVPAAMLRGVDQIVAHSHVAQRGTLEQVCLPGHEPSLAVVGPGFATDSRPMPDVPRLGEHTDAVLAELGYDAGTIAALQAQGAV